MIKSHILILAFALLKMVIRISPVPSSVLTPSFRRPPPRSFFQPADGQQGVNGVSGKTADGFRQYHVDFTAFCIFNHGLEIVTLLGVGGTLSVIGIDARQFPVLRFLYLSGVVFYLCLITAFLFFQFGADSAVGSYPQFLL